MAVTCEIRNDNCFVHNKTQRYTHEYIENNVWAGVVNCLYARRRVILVFIFVHYTDIIMGAMASPITSLAVVYSVVY